MKLHTPTTLYNKWNKYYENNKKRIDALKKRKTTASIKEIPYIERELEELYIASNLIHEILADVGIMVYQNESKN